MIDLAQCHWIVDQNSRLYIASAPSMRAPFRFDCFSFWYETPRRLTAAEAQAIAQAALESGMRPLTFVNSDEGIRFIHSLMIEQAKAA